MQRYLPAQGGAERYWQAISERAVRDGNHVEIYTTNARDIELFWTPGRPALTESAETINGVQVRRFPIRHLFPTALGYRGIRRLLAELSDLGAPLTMLTRLAQFAPYCLALTDALQSLDAHFDLVAGVNIVYESLLLPAFEYAHRNRIPFVLCPFTHLGEANDRSVSRFYTMRHQLWLAAHSDAVFVSTRSEWQYLQERGIANLVLLGTGIDPDRVLGGNAAQAREKFNLESSIILFVGTLSADKGAVQAVQAMAELERRGVEATLVLAGTPLQEFRQFYDAQPASIQARCQLLGFISEEDKRDLLAACAVLVLPSRTDLFPTVFLEAWLYAKPVIGARAGGIPDVIDDERDGLLVHFGDAFALSDALAHVLNDPASAQTLGETGRQKVLARYTWDRLYAKVRQVYERLVAGEGLETGD